MAGVAIAQGSAHVHELRLVEIVFDDGVAVRVYECACGLSDVGVAA